MLRRAVVVFVVIFIRRLFILHSRGERRCYTAFVAGRKRDTLLKPLRKQVKKQRLKVASGSEEKHQENGVLTHLSVRPGPAPASVPLMMSFRAGVLQSPVSEVS